jgi:hypothetical protein
MAQPCGLQRFVWFISCQPTIQSSPNKAGKLSKIKVSGLFLVRSSPMLSVAIQVYVGIDSGVDEHALEKLLALGKYPEVSLKEARERRDEARKLLANCADLGAVKQAQRAEARERTTNTFEVVAERWFEKWKTEVSASTARQNHRETNCRSISCLPLGRFPYRNARTED